MFKSRLGLPLIGIAGIMATMAVAPPAQAGTCAASTTCSTTVTFTVAADGGLQITVPNTASLGSGNPAGQISAQLGSVTVADQRAALTATWVASVVAAAGAFTTGGGTTAETVPNTAVLYWSGPGDRHLRDRDFRSRSGERGGRAVAGRLTHRLQQDDRLRRQLRHLEPDHRGQRPQPSGGGRLHGKLHLLVRYVYAWLAFVRLGSAGFATLSGVAVETDDATGLAVKIAPVRAGGRLEPALPGFWASSNRHRFTSSRLRGEVARRRRG